MIFTITLLGFFCTALIFYELFKGKFKNKEAYYFADRTIGTFSLTATLVMTEFNTATLISFSTLGYLAGLKALLLPAVFLIGLIFYALVVAKKWKKFNGFSVVDFFTIRFGKDIGFLTGIFLLLAMAGFSATYLKSLTLLFSSLEPHMNSWTMSAYLVILTLAMVIRRGLIAIIKTDTLSFLIVIASLSWVLYKSFHLSSEGPTPPINIDPDVLNNDFLISLVPLTMFSYILAPWYGQRIFAAKSEKVAIISVLLSAVFVFILYALAVLISRQMAMSGVMFDDPQMSFPHALHFAFQGCFPSLGNVVLFLISATTLTGVWNSMANIVSDIIPQSRERNNTNILVTILCAFTTYLLSNIFVDNILNKMILANVPVVALSFTLLAGFYWPKVTKEGAYASIITGLISGVFFYVYYGDQGIYTYYWAFFGIPLIFFSGIVTSSFFPGKIERNQQGLITNLN